MSYLVTVTYEDHTTEGFIAYNCYSKDTWFLIFGDDYTSYISISHIKKIDVVKNEKKNADG